MLYDANWDLCHFFALDSKFVHFKTIKEGNESLVLIATQDRTRIYSISSSDSKTIVKSEVKSKNKKGQHLGNPFLDQIYLAFQKYGSHSEFIGSPGVTNLYLCSE